MDEVKDLAHKMHGLEIGDITYSGCYTQLICLAPTAAQAWAPPKSRQLPSTAPSIVLSHSPLSYIPLPPLPLLSNT